MAQDLGEDLFYFIGLVVHEYLKMIVYIHLSIYI